MKNLNTLEEPLNTIWKELITTTTDHINCMKRDAGRPINILINRSFQEPTIRILNIYLKNEHY